MGHGPLQSSAPTLPPVDISQDLLALSTFTDFPEHLVP